MTVNHKPLAAIVRSSDGVKERQADGTYHADQDQVADIERYVAGLPGNPRVVFMDPELDVSGGKPIDERPPLLAAIDGVEAREYGGIVVAYLSRLTRSRSGIEIWERVERAGGHVHCAAENLDTSTPSGRFVRDIHLANAVREREEHVDRFAKRRAATVAAGVWRQHQLPRGYVFQGPPDERGRYRGLARRLAPCPQADEVRGAARDVLAGVPVVRVAERLRMTPNGVRMMLRNPVYRGILRDGPHVNPTAHEPILDAVTFDAVAEALDHGVRPARRADDGPALLAGIAKCAGCGHAMTRARTARVVYGCPVHHSGGRCPAPASITARLLDEHVERLARERYATVVAHGHAAGDVGAAETRVADARGELAALARAVTAAGLDDGDVVDELRARKAQVVDAERRLREARARSLAPVAIPGDEAYASLSAAARNQALRGLIDRVVVERSGKGGRPAVAGRVRVVFRGDD